MTARNDKAIVTLAVGVYVFTGLDLDLKKLRPLDLALDAGLEQQGRQVVPHFALYRESSVGVKLPEDSPCIRACLWGGGHFGSSMENLPYC